MHNRRSILVGTLAAAGMLLLILDSKTALQSAGEGVELCILTLIPSLFPFFFFSNLLTGALAGSKSSLLRPLGRLCRIPAGCEPLFLIGLLGGYPAGAQCIAQAHRQGKLDRENAQRLLGFCNNAGPAFLFGVIGSQFSGVWMIWLLWGIHILSAVFAGMLLPACGDFSGSNVGSPGFSVQDVLSRSLRSMGFVCGWVILFRVMLGFLRRWFLWLLPVAGQVFLAGILELSNGCVLLDSIECSGLRFVVCSVLLAFGGLCVTMQTASAAGDLSLRSYLPGKLMQSFFSLNLAYFLQLVFFPPSDRYYLPVLILPITWICLLFFKFTVAIPKRMMYNAVKP